MISQTTRRAIIDEIVARSFHWSGRLEEQDFLACLNEMEELPSTDGRFSSAYGDVWQHRVRNHDWDDDWVFHDDRFNLLNGPDEVFLRFLAETVHPVLRRRQDEVETIVAMYNQHLRQDGVELAEITQLAGQPVYAGRNTIAVPPALRHVEASVSLDDVDYMTQQITHMESAIDSDPELAIGTAKELVETCCGTILRERGREPDRSWDLARLVKEASKSLQLTPEDVPPDARAGDAIRRVLGGLGGVVAGLRRPRNDYGTGHGKALGGQNLDSQHARLAVGAASTLAVFLFDSFEHPHGSPDQPLVP